MGVTKKFKKKDGVGYSGSVEIGLYRDGRKIKKMTTNAGSVNLFRYLCGCLAGTINADYNINERPGKLRLFNNNEQLLTYGIGFNDYKIEEGGTASNPTCAITINFLIPGTVLVNRAVTKVMLLPMSDNQDNWYAEAEFTETLKVDSKDSNIYVAWTLTIYNG